MEGERGSGNGERAEAIEKGRKGGGEGRRGYGRRECKGEEVREGGVSCWGRSGITRPENY